MAYPSLVNVNASIAYLEAVFTEDETHPLAREYFDTLKHLTALLPKLSAATYPTITEQSRATVDFGGA